MALTERVPHLNSTPAAGVKLAEIHQRALQHGLAIRTGNGGYMVVDLWGDVGRSGFPTYAGVMWKRFFACGTSRRCNSD
jgi:hypothetical protein